MRLLKAENDIQDLKAQIANQKATWEMRFMELQKRQHDLRDQVCGHLCCSYSMHLLNETGDKLTLEIKFM